METYQTIDNNNKEENDDQELIIQPKPNAQVHISEVNLSQYLTSSR